MLEEVTREVAGTLQQYPLVILAGGKDVQTRQAFTRLTRVYGLSNVRILEDSHHEE